MSLDRYLAAGHAIQTGVKEEIRRRDEQEPRVAEQVEKHLRVGLNLARTDHAALVQLLIAKGIISDAEYVEALAVEAEREKAAYEKRLGVTLG